MEILRLRLSTKTPTASPALCEEMLEFFPSILRIRQEESKFTTYVYSSAGTVKEPEVDQKTRLKCCDQERPQAGAGVVRASRAEKVCTPKQRDS